MRKHFIASVSVVALLSGVAACGGDADEADDGAAEEAASSGDDEATESDDDSAKSDDAAEAADGTPTAATGPLEFTDDRGETITWDEAPTRVVAWQAIVPALADLGIEPVGIIAFQDLSDNPSYTDAGVDLDGIELVSEVYGEVNLEALAALDPDVIITYDFGSDPLLGFNDEGMQSSAAEIAPLVALDGGATVMDGIERLEELGEVLGADLASEAHQENVAAFDEAISSVESLAAERPGLTVAFGTPFPDGLFLAPVSAYPELQLYQELGLDVFDGPEDASVSWELVGDVPADILMIDDRTIIDIEEAENFAIWEAIPAVAADQVSQTWRYLLAYSRGDYARTMNRMLPALEAAVEDVVG